MRRKSFHLFIEKEEQNIHWDSSQVGKRWIKAKTYSKMNKKQCNILWKA